MSENSISQSASQHRHSASRHSIPDSAISVPEFPWLGHSFPPSPVEGPASTEPTFPDLTAVSSHYSERSIASLRVTVIHRGTGDELSRTTSRITAIYYGTSHEQRPAYPSGTFLYRCVSYEGEAASTGSTGSTAPSITNIDGSHVDLSTTSAESTAPLLSVSGFITTEQTPIRPSSPPNPTSLFVLSAQSTASSTPTIAALPRPRPRNPKQLAPQPKSGKPPLTDVGIPAYIRGHLNEDLTRPRRESSISEHRTIVLSRVFRNPALLRSLAFKAPRQSRASVRFTPHATPPSRSGGAKESVLPASTLATTAKALCAWRFQTFYSRYLEPRCHQGPGMINDRDIRAAVEKVDWMAASEELEAACYRYDCLRRRGLGFTSMLVLKNESVFKIVKEAARNTEIPFVQIRRAIEAYACYQLHGKCATPKRLAEHQKWDKLAAIVCQDIEDIEKGQIWIPEIDSNTDILIAVRKCRDRYFSLLGYVRRGGLFRMNTSLQNVKWSPTPKLRIVIESYQREIEMEMRKKGDEKMRVLSQAAVRVREQERAKEDEVEERVREWKRQRKGTVGETVVGTPLAEMSEESKEWEKERRRIEKD